MEDTTLNFFGAIFMAVSWSIVIGLNIFSFYKIFEKNNKNKG